MALLGWTQVCQVPWACWGWGTLPWRVLRKQVLCLCRHLRAAR